jgi:hypothetical protein
MICPHCSTAVKFEWRYEGPLGVTDKSPDHFLIYDTCPNCNEIVVFLSICNYDNNNGYMNITSKDDGEFDIVSEQQIYPDKGKFGFPEFIPKEYMEDYEESIKVLSASPKASAALSRRLLQLILREKFKIVKRTLSDEIEEFINLEGIPSHITDAIDAIRHIGNLAAHPTKNSNTGEIVNVEPGEAEWLIEVIEALFDFSFVQPKKLEQRKKDLNLKLKELGKPLLKEKK